MSKSKEYDVEYQLTDKERESLARIRNDGKDPPKYTPYHSSMRSTVDIPKGLGLTWNEPQFKKDYIDQLRKEEARLGECYEGLKVAVEKHGSKEIRKIYESYGRQLENVKRQIKTLQTAYNNGHRDTEAMDIDAGDSCVQSQEKDQ